MMATRFLQALTLITIAHNCHAAVTVTWKDCGTTANHIKVRGVADSPRCACASIKHGTATPPTIPTTR